MKKFLIILIIFFLFTFFSCSAEQQCVSVINKYISYSKSAKFEKIYQNLLTGPALESFSRYAKDIASNKDNEQFNVVVDTFKKIKGIKVLAVEKFDNDEIAIKFQFIRKDGVIEDTPWWRFKKVDGKMKIMKFSKH
ncbi:MAG: hypothetical protein NUV32_04215 [Exilispira sp.]|jgi:hypothetical protein|nr:hypothetical protein [Exilispira sp.]